MPKKKDEITIRSSAAEYLTYVAYVGEEADSIEMRCEGENIWLTQKMIARLHAEMEFEKYRVIRDRFFMSDFDKYMLELQEAAKGSTTWNV